MAAAILGLVLQGFAVMAVSQHHSLSIMVYPVADGEPLAETYDHLYAIQE
jgi:hypothetical protein